MTNTIEFTAIPHSARRMKGTDDGGGYRVTLDIDEGQFEAWAKLAKVSGNLLTFSAELK